MDACCGAWLDGRQLLLDICASSGAHCAGGMSSTAQQRVAQVLGAMNHGMMGSCFVHSYPRADTRRLTQTATPCINNPAGTRCIRTHATIVETQAHVAQVGCSLQ